MRPELNRTILILSLPLVTLIVVASCVGILTPCFYSKETLNWQAQSIGQDIVDLFLIAPSLLLTSIFASRNNRVAFPVWAGITLYLTYTFILYCFDIHFNVLFLLYCATLGSSFYSFMYFLLTSRRQEINFQVNKPACRIIGIYFIVISTVFCLLWLTEVIPSIINKSMPKSISDAGLVTNGVHVLDLAIILPSIFMIGLSLLKQQSLGILLAPVFLTFFILTDLTIGALTIIMNMRGIESNLTLSMVMGLLALVSLSLLILYFKSVKLPKQ